MSDPTLPGSAAGMAAEPPSAAVVPGPGDDTALAHRRGPGAPDAEPRAVGSAATVEHVVDIYRRYPGEVITFYTRVQVHQPLPGFTLQVQLPPGVEVDTYQSNDPQRFPLLTQRTLTREREAMLLPGIGGDPFPVALPDRHAELITQTAQVLIWQVAEAQEAGATLTFETAALVLPTPKEMALRSTAALTIGAGEQATVTEAVVEFAVESKGRYLRFLPALFEQDDFLARFLMLFESFWEPINRQIQEVEQVFDPDMTPAVFLPWLAGWFNLTLDENWAEDQQRELLGIVMWLYRRRGTRVALQRYLEIFTRQPVEIVERRARNFALGRGARLGVGVAIGTANRPHTFTVRLRLSPIAAPANLTGEAAQKEVARLEAKRLALIERLIQAEKPAHTAYHLEVVEA